MAVLPVPQGRNSRASSSPRSVAVAAEVPLEGGEAAVGGPDERNGILHVPLDSMQQV